MAAPAGEWTWPRSASYQHCRSRSFRIPFFAGVAESSRNDTRRFSVDELEPTRHERVLFAPRESSRTRD